MQKRRLSILSSKPLIASLNSSQRSVLGSIADVVSVLITVAIDSNAARAAIPSSCSESFSRSAVCVVSMYY